MIQHDVVFSQEFNADPYALYAELRRKGPVHPIDFPRGVPAFLVVDYEHGRAALNDARLSKDTRNSAVPVDDGEFFGGTMLGLDPPDHTRLRGLVVKAFTGRRVEAMRPRIERITGELLDGLAERGGGDLIQDLAVPLPVRVICEMLGVPASDLDRFRAWTAVLTVPATTPEARARRRTMALEFSAYLTDVIADRRAAPRDDLVSGLVQARDGDAVLTEIEMINIVGLLLVAGHETTVNLVGNGVLALLRDPGQLRLLRGRPELLPAAVEELLRFDGPITRATQRVALEDMEIAGRRVRAGEGLVLPNEIANRDPEAFPDPDRLDITREARHHVAFGFGVHQCLGQPLARLELEVVYRTLYRRAPGLRLATDFENIPFKHDGFVYGVYELPVAW